MTRGRAGWVGLMGIGYLAAWSGCVDELDTTRFQQQRGTLGEEIFRILKADLDRLHPEKGEAFGRERGRFVQALDTVFPDDLLKDQQAYMVGTLSLYDEQRIPGASQAAACLLSELSQDQDVLHALWFALRPDGYGKNESALLLRRLLAHPEVPGLLSDLANLWLAHDGLDGEFGPAQEDDTLAALWAEGCRSLQDSEISADFPDSRLGALSFLP